VSSQSAVRRHLVIGVLAVLALALFGRLTLRHVGESYFLADQVDQLQKFEALLRFDPEGLWGPVMSGTTAHALGPFGAFVFGLPVALGFGIDAVHVFTSLLLVAATAIVFWQLARLDAGLAWAWLIVFTSMRMIWWSAAMFWVNTLLLPLGLALLALFAASLGRPSMAKLAVMTLVVMCALQQHLIAVVGLPVLAIAAVRFWRSGSRPADHGRHAFRRTALTLGAVVGIGLLPYAIAEGRTQFRNTRAMFSHVDAAAHSSSAAGRQAALDSLVLATDPAAVFAAPRTAILAGAAITLAGLILVSFRRRLATDPAAQDQYAALRWLLVATVVGIAGQAVFYLLMARPLNGLHYAMLLAPWYPIPAAVLVAALLPGRDSVAATMVSGALGFVAIGLLVARAPTLADRFAERTPWNYRAIVTALDSLCASESVDTIEGPGLVDELTPSYDSVLRYVMKRGYSRCRYVPGSAVLIVANRSGTFDDSIEFNGRTFARERVLDPGIARYGGR